MGTDETSEPATPAGDLGHAGPLGELGPQDVLDRLDEIAFLTDAGGRWLYLNPAWTRITGFDVEATLGTNFLDYVHPDEREHTIALFMAVVAGGADHCHHRTRYRTAEGGHRWVELRARVLRDDAGQVTHNVGTILDITERSAAEEILSEHHELLELVAGAIATDLPVGVVRYGPDLTVREVSPGLSEVLGPAVRPGQSVDELSELFRVPDDASAVLGGEWGLVATALRTGRPQHADLRLVRAGLSRWRAFQVSVMPLPEGPGDRLVLVLQDVTDLRRAELQQAAVARLGQRALAGADLAILLDEAVALVSETLDTPFCEVLELLGQDGLLARAAVGWPAGPHGVTLVPADPPLQFLERTLAEGRPVAVDDVRSDPAWSAHQWLADSGIVSSLSVLIGGRGEAFGVLGVQTATTRSFSTGEVDFLQAVANVLATAIERGRAEEQTRHDALHDPLTGLANRVLLHDRLQHALSGWRRTGRQVALLLMDLDRFKEINDTLGHDVGDEVLRVVGGRLGDSMRDTDTVARLGGDEFAVVLTEVGGTEDAVWAAAKAREQVAKVIDFDGVPLRVDGSVGIAVAPDHGDDPTVLLKRADVAMYRAKHLARGVAVYSRASDENRPERLTFFAALRAAIETDQLLLHFQPKVELATGETTAVEALVRWQHPERGLIGPAMFIPLAEQTGLIEAVTRRVLALALDEASSWRRQGHPLPVAVNISARVLQDPGLVDLVAAQLRRAGVPPEGLELEVTESAMMADPATAMSVFRRLRRIGVQLSIDDFGIGYSSLAYLRNLPVHELKIDSSFVRDVAHNDRDASIVRSVVELGHNLRLRVVGEGIETAEAHALLLEVGCDEGQGFFLAPPVPASQLPAAIDR